MTISKNITFVATTLFLTVGLRAEQPEASKELKALEDNYQQAVQHAIEPLHARYVSDLTRLRENFTHAGKLHEALAVDEVLKTVSTDSPDTAAITEAKTLVIQSTSDAGTTIGRGKKGQRVTVQYINGQWKLSPGDQATSPDNTPKTGANVALMGVADGAEETIASVPNGTKAQPFTATLTKDYERIFLRISDGIRGDNSGQAIYKASIR